MELAGVHNRGQGVGEGRRGPRDGGRQLVMGETKLSEATSYLTQLYQSAFSKRSIHLLHRDICWSVDVMVTVSSDRRNQVESDG